MATRKFSAERTVERYFLASRAASDVSRSKHGTSAADVSLWRTKCTVAGSLIAK
jgi:hypothetical protein